MTPKIVCILSIDGGGIRGIIPATILEYVEDYLEQKVPGTTLADHFDFIAGTSTGGILTRIYLTPQKKDSTKAKFKAAEALDFYIYEGYKIFNASKLSGLQRLWGLRRGTTYSAANLEQLFLEKFGDLKISALLKPCLMTTYNMNTTSAFFFTSNEDKNKREFYVRDVLRSTAAAPTYFPPAVIKNLAPNASMNDEVLEMINLDGGVFANNPTMCAYAEARNTNFVDRNNKEPAASDMYILSLGTGGGGFDLKKKESSNRWNLLKWAKAVPEIMMDGSLDAVAFQMNEINSTRQEGEQGDYMRVDFPKHIEQKFAADMADASLENIKDLMDAGKLTLDHAKANGLDAFINGLLD